MAESTYRKRGKRQGPTYRDKWKAAVIKTATLPSPTKLFLTGVLAVDMDPTGRVSTPRDTLAGRMGCDERSVSRHIQRAKDAGWLTVAQAGYRGMTAIYRAAFPVSERMTPAVTLSTVQKGDTLYHPLRVTELSPISARATRKGDTCCHPKVSTYVETGGWATTDKAQRGCVLDLGFGINESKSKSPARHVLAVSA